METAELLVEVATVWDLTEDEHQRGEIRIECPFHPKAHILVLGFNVNHDGRIYVFQKDKSFLWSSPGFPVLASVTGCYIPGLDMEGD